MENLFRKIGKSTTLSQEILEEIEKLIRDKKILPGEKLPTEKEMCEMFGVSRTALREALQKLSAKGLVNIKKGSGAYVEDYDIKHVIKPMNLYHELNLDREYMIYLVEIRQMIEPEVARSAAIHRTNDDLEKLEESIKSLEQCNKENCYQEGKIDRKFHLVLANACKNPIIPMIVDPIFQLMPKMRTLVYANINTAKSEAVDYHKKIYNKIREKDGEGAYLVMKDHLAVAERHTKEVAGKI